MLVMKFGGTSVQDAPAIRRLVEIVGSRKGPRLVVVSALAKVTDALLEIGRLCSIGDTEGALSRTSELEDRHRQVARELGLNEENVLVVEELFRDLKGMVISLASLREVSPRSKDRLASYGELCSSLLVAGAFHQAGQKSEWADARLSIRTGSEFTEAKVDWKATEKAVQSHFKAKLNDTIIITQGFIGSNIEGLTTTLGRGGSDYSAAIFGATLPANRVEIWTDVNGILSTDPRLVPEAKTIRAIHFLEAAEMAFFGAKVLHPETIYPAVQRQIPVAVLNSKNPADPGTEITFRAGADGVKGIAFKKGVTVVNIHSGRMLGAYGFLKTVFDVFAKYKLSVDLISTSEVNISLTLDPNYNMTALKSACEELNAFGEVEVRTEQTMISVIGRGVRQSAGLAARVFGEIKDIPVHMISMGASELNLSFVVHVDQTAETVRRLHSALLGS